MYSQAKKNYFTLIELFVVIAIMTSMLIPELNHVRAKVQLIHCANNLKQLNPDYYLYCDDNDNFLAPSFATYATCVVYWSDPVASQKPELYQHSKLSLSYPTTTHPYSI